MPNATGQCWRWDQGRLDYFQFENIRTIARCLINLDGVELNQDDIDPLRPELERQTGLPFAPITYKIWRNYKRVFECAFLATNINGRLCITDFCRRIASSDDEAMNCDEFFSLFIPRFRFPFPGFQDYRNTGEVIYPFCAVMKYLLSGFISGKEATLSLENAFSLIIGNDCTGLEPMEHYANLSKTDYEASNDERRQVREMLIYISQLSMLKWHNGLLLLDISMKDYVAYNGFDFLITPVFSEPKEMREEDYLAITSLTDEIVYPFQLESREAPTDRIFIEGKKSRVTHIRTERSPLLRKLFFAKYPTPICNMCTCNTKNRYPWTDNILEVHHILPLSSSLIITTEGTSLEDVVGICPNCHKSVHSFYRMWLDDKHLNDFRNKNEAKEIYSQAKSSIAA